MMGGGYLHYPVHLLPYSTHLSAYSSQTPPPMSDGTNSHNSSDALLLAHILLIFRFFAN